MKCKKFTMDSFVLSNKKLLGFCFFVNSNLKKDKIMATMEQYMSTINPKYSIYVSPKEFECQDEEIKSFEQIQTILKNSINPDLNSEA